ncbi:MAG: SRPBCC family protein [Gammaproteobacteria bacterium]|nr:SRPBCC family protein [Gammaproteobacteria bacterium]
MLKTITIIVVVLIAVLLVYAATRPDTFRVQRATNIKTPPEKIFALINDFHSWGSWSAYEQKDPAMKRTYSGAANGEGAVYEWEGDKNVGKAHGDHGDISTVQGPDQTGFHQAVRNPQHR